MDEIRKKHWQQLRKQYSTPRKLSFLRRSYRQVLAHYYHLLLPPEGKIMEIGCGEGSLLKDLLAYTNENDEKQSDADLSPPSFSGLDLSPDMVTAARRHLPDISFFEGIGEIYSFEGKYDVLLLSDTLNESADVQTLLENLRGALHPEGRLVLNVHNTLWRPLLGVAAFFRCIPRRHRQNWLSGDDVANLLDLSGWDVVRREPRILVPAKLGGIGTAINRLLAPLLPWFCLSIFFVARLRPETDIQSKKSYSVSVIVPARNEEGNIASVIRRVPKMGTTTEIVFVEGNSTDHTWDRIQEAAKDPPPGISIKALQQPGKGKGDAMRAGYAVATGEIFMILDADLTVPPEDLPKFYHCLAAGQADFVNGVRLVYPMEDEAMRFINMCGNKFFSMVFSWILGFPIKDTLCGTKVFWRNDYSMIAHTRKEFGDIDPFGDFDLIFAARKLNLKVRDIPIRYQNRSYGETQIHRWKDGWRLLKMVVFAARTFKFS